MVLNDNEVIIPSRIKFLKAFRDDVRDLFLLHIAYIFFVNDHYMMSSDYVDALECGMQPEADSQYWVAPFIQDIFDTVVTPFRPDIVSVIRDTSAMHLQ